MKASLSSAGTCSREVAAVEYWAKAWVPPTQPVRDSRWLTKPQDVALTKYQKHVRRRVKPGRCLPAVVTAEDVTAAAEWFFADQQNCQHSPGRRVDATYLLTALRIAAKKADYRTGRFAELSRFTLMREGGLTNTTAKRCLAVLQATGFLYVISRGYLNKKTGHSEANVYQLALPQEAREYLHQQHLKTRPVDNSGPVPLKGEVFKRNLLISKVKTRPTNGPGSNRAPKKSHKKIYEPLPRSEYEFARELKTQLPWLRKTSVHQVARILRRFQLDIDRWKYVSDLVRVININNRQLTGGGYHIPEIPKSPLGFLFILLAWTLPHINELTPDEKRLIDNEKRLREQNERLKEHAAEEERLKTIDYDEIARIKQASDKEIAERNRTKRYTQRSTANNERLQSARDELESLRQKQQLLV